MCWDSLQPRIEDISDENTIFGLMESFLGLLISLFSAYVLGISLDPFCAFFLFLEVIILPFWPWNELKTFWLLNFLFDCSYMVI